MNDMPLEAFEKRTIITKTALFAVLASFLVFVLMPTIYIVSFTFTRWEEIYSEVFANPIIASENWFQIQRVLLFSFRIALFTIAFDFIFGIPLAYLLAHKRFVGKGILEDIITLPLVIPTSGFGFATLITWTTVSGLGGVLGFKSGLLNLADRIPLINIPFLIFAVHVGLTLPYVVLTIRAKLQELDPVFEVASRTLGAVSLTTFRRIVFPLALPGIFSGLVLAFARSLGETGATMVVAGVSTTASIAIVRWVFEFKFATASFLGCLLVVIAWALILPVEILLRRKRRLSISRSPLQAIGIEGQLLSMEKFVSRRLHYVKEVASITVIVLMVVVPIVIVLNSIFPYWFRDPYTGRFEGGVIYQLFGPSNYFGALSRATLTSFAVAAVSTYIAACIAIPLVYVIERYRFGTIIRSILKIPLIVPTSALGLSVLLLWGPRGLGMVNPGIWLIILTHIVFSVPVIVEPTIAAYEGSEIQSYEESARTLGATSYDAAETISLPLLKRGILAGVILSFTHSLGETGATFIVMGSDLTVPTLVVNMVEALAIPAALFSSAYLIAISLVLLAVFRFLTRR